jgi:hypothetical protein
MKMKKKILYYATFSGGGCTLVEASSIKVAREYLFHQYGCSAEPRVVKATEENEDWVKAMGGAVHEA